MPAAVVRGEAVASGARVADKEHGVERSAMSAVAASGVMAKFLRGVKFLLRGQEEGLSERMNEV